MGRKSLAEKFYEETSEEEDGEEEIWLVLYDFGSKSNPRFWGNVRRLMGLVGEGLLVRARTFLQSVRTRKTVLTLTDDYSLEVQ